MQKDFSERCEILRKQDDYEERSREKQEKVGIISFLLLISLPGQMEAK